MKILTPEEVSNNAITYNKCVEELSELSINFLPEGGHVEVSKRLYDNLDLVKSLMKASDWVVEDIDYDDLEDTEESYDNPDAKMCVMRYSPVRNSSYYK